MSLNAQAATITIFGDGWCPYNCNSQEAPGFMIDAAREIFAKAGHTVEYTVTSWKRAKREVQLGNVDAVVGMTVTETTGGLYILPEGDFHSSKICFFTRSGDDWTFTGLDSLDSIHLGLINDYGYWEEGEPGDVKFGRLAANGKAEVVSTEKPLRQLIRMLLAERIEAFPEDKLVTLNLVQEMGKLDLIREAGCQEKFDRVTVAFSKERETSAEYARILTEGLKRLNQSGRYQELVDRYTK